MGHKDDEIKRLKKRIKQLEDNINELKTHIRLSNYVYIDEPSDLVLTDEMLNTKLKPKTLPVSESFGVFLADYKATNGELNVKTFTQKDLEKLEDELYESDPYLKPLKDLRGIGL